MLAVGQPHHEIVESILARTIRKLAPCGLCLLLALCDEILMLGPRPARNDCVRDPPRLII